MPWMCLCATYNAPLSSICETRLLLNVCMRTRTLRNYASGMCMGQAHTTTTSVVRNDSDLPKADDGEANVSAYIPSDEKLYQSKYFGTERGDSLASYHNVYLRSH